MTNDDEFGAEELLEFLRDSRGVDFTGYKRPSLTRRIRKRMDVVEVANFEAYMDYVELHPDEHSALVDMILINVTGFFRDAEAWTYLADEVVPALIARRPDDAQLRIWSAGCASGEEAYSLAMLFADHLGMDAFKSRVKIFATDTDEQTLVEARSGSYIAKQLESVPSDFRERFFKPVDGRFVIDPDCRRSVIFGRNDIARDAPISRLDLLVCRNLLMYLGRDTQRGVLSRFHYALGTGGVLFLGKAETIFAHADLFTPMSSSFRIFSRAAEPDGKEQLLSLATLPPATDSGRLSGLASAASPVSQMVVTVDGTLLEANSKAMAMFGVTARDLGRPLRDLEVSFRPIELRSRIEQAFAQASPVVVSGVHRPLADGQVQFLKLTVTPLIDAAGRALGVSVTFADVTDLGQAKAELEESARDLEIANESLYSSNEELETSNEELQSTNEELETMNEELQSANEELETMNEELQSANEELETMNEELIDQATHIELAGEFLSGLLDSLTVGVVVLDDRFNVTIWNRAMEHIFGLRAEEVAGQAFLELDIGLPVSEIGPLLKDAARGVQSEPSDVILDAVNRTGRPFHCRVTACILGVARDSTDAADGEFVLIVDPLPPES